MVYGVLKLLNFAHGDLYMSGVTASSVIQVGGPQHLTIAVPCCGDHVRAGGGPGRRLGVAIERFAYRPLRDAPRIAAADHRDRRLVLPGELGPSVVRPQYRVYNTADFISRPRHPDRLGHHRQRADPGPGAGVVRMAGLQLLVNRTRLGRQIGGGGRPEAAEMLGINVNFVITATFSSARPGGRGRDHGRLLFNQ